MSGKISITINGRSFPIHCNPGDEDRVKELGDYVDQKARELTKNFSGKVHDLHLMVMVSILLADELRDALSENERLENQIESNAVEAPKVENPLLSDPRFSDPNFLKAVEMLASRMENIAENIQSR